MLELLAPIKITDNGLIYLVYWLIIWEYTPLAKLSNLGADVDWNRQPPIANCQQSSRGADACSGSEGSAVAGSEVESIAPITPLYLRSADCRAPRSTLLNRRHGVRLALPEARAIQCCWCNVAPHDNGCLVDTRRPWEPTERAYSGNALRTTFSVGKLHKNYEWNISRISCILQRLYCYSSSIENKTMSSASRVHLKVSRLSYQ